MRPPDYFEGTLQLRECSDEIVSFVRKRSFKESPSMIAKEKKVRNGIDFLMQSNRFLLRLSKELSRHFRGTVKTSRKLFTRNKQTSKNVYRVTVLFRQSPFEAGDRIILDGGPYTIASIGKKVILRCLKSGKKEALTLEDLRQRKARHA